MSSRTERAKVGNMQRSLVRAGFTDRQLQAREITIHYVEGPKNGPLLVLIPGQSMTWDSYTRALPLLAPRFHVVAVDVRGHGGSSWTPGAYDFPTMGADAAALIEHLADGPAFVSGNSSGGLIALWLAANRPELVAGIVMEDAPIFSAEWPRLKDDCYVYQVFEQVAVSLADPRRRDMAGFFAGLKVPVERGQRLWSLPKWIMEPIGWLSSAHEAIWPGQPVDLPILPPSVRLIVRSLTAYDPQFSIAFLDGSACRDFDHAENLSRVRCPVMFMHADWFRVGGDGMLVGSADEDDIARMRDLVPSLRYVRLHSGHMIHFYNPGDFSARVAEFVDDVVTNREGAVGST